VLVLVVRRVVEQELAVGLPVAPDDDLDLLDLAGVVDL
jgi:hypothetical protein